MNWDHIAEQLVASAPGTALVIGAFAKAIRELRRADLRHMKLIAALTRRVDRLCDRFGEEVTGRHSIVPPAEEEN